MLSDEKIKKADSHDVQSAKSRYGYVGYVYDSLNARDVRIGENLQVVNLLKSKALARPALTIARSKNGQQKKIELPNEKTMYGYNLSSRKKDDPGRDLYFENPVNDLIEKMNTYKQNGHDVYELDEILLSALSRSSDWSLDSKTAQYGYAGRFMADGNIAVDSEIITALKKRIEKVMAANEFKKLAEEETTIKRNGREDDYTNRKNSRG